MKYLILLTILLLFSCKDGSNFYINRFFKSQELTEKDKEKKEKKIKEYEKIIKHTLEAYDENAGLNKDLGHKLLMNRNYNPALTHLKRAFEIKSNDAAVSFDIAVCYVNLYKIEDDAEHLLNAEKYYKIALKITPNNKGYLYSYAQLMVFGKNDYTSAITLLNKIIVELNTKDIDSYFLLGRAYYMAKMYKESHNMYMQLYDFEKKLTDEQRTKLDQFVRQSLKMMKGQ